MQIFRSIPAAKGNSLVWVGRKETFRCKYRTAMDVKHCGMWAFSLGKQREKPKEELNWRGWRSLTSSDLKLLPCMPCFQKASTLSWRHTAKQGHNHTPFPASLFSQSLWRTPQEVEKQTLPTKALRAAGNDTSPELLQSFQKRWMMENGSFPFRDRESTELPALSDLVLSLSRVYYSRNSCLTATIQVLKNSYPSLKTTAWEWHSNIITLWKKMDVLFLEIKS